MKRKTIWTAAIVLVVLIPFMVVARVFYNAAESARILLRARELQRSNASPDEIDKVLRQLPQQQVWINKAIAR